jgi:DNA helicase-2/ATP-dependent DNA helicase PcrA
VAVFYRVNAASRAIELALREAAIPYVVVMGVEFFQRREVKDLLAYARLVENPRDEVAFSRVVNVPRRGIGATALGRVREAATERGVSLTEAAAAGVARLSGRAAAGLASFLEVLERARRLDRRRLGDLLVLLAEASGYRASLDAEADTLGDRRVENLDELVAFARSFERKEPGADLKAFLERTALVADQDAFDEESGRVSLMTVHAAKGLEFRAVVLAAAEDGYFPHDRSEGEEAVEEERRLFYVALTRARERLVVTHAARRAAWRGPERRFPSPFLRDVPRSLLEVEDRVSSWPEDPWGGVDQVADREADGGDEAGIEVGTRVRHPYFGDGLLTDRHGRGSGCRVTVDFDAHGTKQLLLSHARLEKIP